MRAGDWELRAAVIRLIAPYLLCYCKSLYHDLSLTDLDGIERLSAAERGHIGERFSLWYYTK